MERSPRPLSGAAYPPRGSGSSGAARLPPGDGSSDNPYQQQVPRRGSLLLSSSPPSMLPSPTSQHQQPGRPAFHQPSPRSHTHLPYHSGGSSPAPSSPGPHASSSNQPQPHHLPYPSYHHHPPHLPSPSSARSTAAPGHQPTLAISPSSPDHRSAPLSAPPMSNSPLGGLPQPPFHSQIPPARSSSSPTPVGGSRGSSSSDHLHYQQHQRERDPRAWDGPTSSSSQQQRHDDDDGDSGSDSHGLAYLDQPPRRQQQGRPLSSSSSSLPLPRMGSAEMGSGGSLSENESILSSAHSGGAHQAARVDDGDSSAWGVGQQQQQQQGSRSRGASAASSSSIGGGRDHQYSPYGQQQQSRYAPVASSKLMSSSSVMDEVPKHHQYQRPPSVTPSSPPSASSHLSSSYGGGHSTQHGNHPPGHLHHQHSLSDVPTLTDPYQHMGLNSSSALSHASSSHQHHQQQSWGGGGGGSSAGGNHQMMPVPSHSNQRDYHQQQQQQQQSQSQQLSGGGGSGGGQPRETTCGACGLAVTGPFVRALRSVYHLDCFKCQDCNTIVAAKFFPVEAKDGKQYPLCETDYFRRLNLICHSCGLALRGSYITACEKKYHVEHFQCSACPMLFGPQDSYYEHDGEVFCHFHYSTRFATKCVGCGVAILKQFVEINRNQQDECWHPECYMIQKFWNVKLLSRFTSSSASSSAAPSRRTSTASSLSGSGAASPQRVAAELEETAESLKRRQQEMERHVQRVWTVLSAFEESSAACISDMLSHVSNSLYMEAVHMAEKFIFHVEVLFATIDELEAHFAAADAKGMSHVREAKLLCRTTVNFFSLLAHTHETGAHRTTGITADLLSLVTRLAHYLKILIRIALTGALKLEREHGDSTALSSFLDRLSLLARDSGDPAARRRRAAKARAAGEEEALKASSLNSTSPFAFDKFNYGYRSLCLTEGESLLKREVIVAGGSNDAKGDGAVNGGAAGELPLDICVACAKPVEDDCIRLGTFPHWHAHCVQCAVCGKLAAPYVKEEKRPPCSTAEDQKSSASKAVLPRRPPPAVDLFVYQPRVRGPPSSSSPSTNGSVSNTSLALASTLPEAIFCVDHGSERCLRGFEAVTRLEQFAFLLNAALRRLYNHLRAAGVVASVPSHPASAHESAAATSMYDAYRDSNDIQRMKSVNLDRKLSSTTAHVPKRSTVVESPSGKVAAGGSSSPAISAGGHPVLTPMHHTSSQQSSSSSLTASKGLPSVPPLPAGFDYARRSSLVSPQQSRPTSSASNVRPTGRSLAANGSTSREHSPSGLALAPSPLGGEHAALTTSVIRPAFARNNTSIKIVSEQPPDGPSGASSGARGGGSEAAGGPVDGPQLLIEPEKAFGEHLSLSDLSQALVEEQQARGNLIERPLAAAQPAHPPAERRLIADLTPVQMLTLKHFAVLQLQKSSLAEAFDLDEILDLMSKKNTFWNKLFKGGKKEKEVKKKGVFGVPLDQLVERAGSDSVLGATSAHLKVPTFLEDIIAAMKQMDMSIEGIFRKNGNIRRLKDVVDALDKDPSTVNLADENPVQLAALLKKFFRDMPDPLLTFRLHRLFCHSQLLPSEAERKRYLHLVVCLLPRYNRDSMEILFVFLKWVASFSHVDEETGSKMDLANLSTVLAPSILYSKGGNPLRDESFVAIKAVTALLQMQDEFYAVPAELLRILDPSIVDFVEKNIDLPARDMLKTCSKIHLQIQDIRRRGPMPGGQPALARGESGGASRLPSHRSDSNLAQTAAAAASPNAGGGPGSMHPPGGGSPGSGNFTNGSPPSLGPGMSSNSPRPLSWADRGGTVSSTSTQANNGPLRPALPQSSFSHNPTSSSSFEDASSPRRGAHSPLAGNGAGGPGVEGERRSFASPGQNSARNYPPR